MSFFKIKRNELQCTIFLDVAQAFDKTWHAGLLDTQLSFIMRMLIINNNEIS